MPVAAVGNAQTLILRKVRAVIVLIWESQPRLSRSPLDVTSNRILLVTWHGVSRCLAVLSLIRVVDRFDVVNLCSTRRFGVGSPSQR